MGQLTNLYVSSSYQGLLKLTDSTTGLTPTLQTVQDGLGGDSPLQISQTEVNISGAFTVNGQPVSFDSGSLVTTSSFNAYTSSVNTHLAGLDIETGSLQSQIDGLATTGSLSGYTTTTTFNNYTSSNDTKVNDLISKTGSYASQTGVTALSSSIAATDLGQNNVIAGLATTSSLTSLSSSIATTDLNQNNVIAGLATTSSLTSLSSSIASTDLSQDNRITALEGVTGSINRNGLITTGSVGGTQSITGSVNVSGTITATSASFTYVNTIYETASVIYSSGSNQLGDASNDTQTLWGRVAIPSGPVSVTGSVTATNFTGSLQGNASTATSASFATIASNSLNLGGQPSSVYARRNSTNTFTQDQTIQSGSALFVNQIETGANERLIFLSDGNPGGQGGRFIFSDQTGSPETSVSITGSLGVSAGITGSLQGNATSATNTTLFNNRGIAQFALTGSNSFNGNQTITGSVTASAGFSGNLTGTASYATQALSASWAPDTTNTGSFVTNVSSSSLANNIIEIQKADGSYLSAITIDNVPSASFATNALSASWAPDTTNTGSLVTDVSNGLTNDVVVVTYGDGSTHNFTVNDVNNSVSSSYSTNSLSASFATNALSASYAPSIDTSYFATTGSNQFNGSQSISGSVTLSGSLNNVDYIDFNTGSSVPAWKSGRVYWDNTDGAISVYNAEADISLQVGQEMWVRARNNTGAPIVNGAAVRLVGALGDNPLIVLAQSVQVSGSVNTDNQILGVATHTIEDGTDGYVTTLGNVRGLNTNAYTAGDVLFVSSSAGLLTNVVPVAPYEIIPVATVVKVGPGGSGIIYVAPQPPIDFSDLSSVQISGSYENGDIWNYEGNVWKHKQISEIGLATTSSVNQKLDTGSFNTYTASMDARTGSYATTGSNTFIGSETIQSGSLIFRTSLNNTPYAVTESSFGTSNNLLFGSSIASVVNTGSFSITGSNNIVTAQFPVAVGYKNTINGHGNIQLGSAGMLLSTASLMVPITSANIGGGSVQMYFTTSSLSGGVPSVSNNYLQGFTNLQIPSGSLTMQNNSSLTSITINASGSAHNTRNTYSQNFNSGPITLNAISSSIAASNNYIGAGLTVNNHYTSSNTTGNQFNMNRNIIGGNSVTLNISGSNDGSTAFAAFNDNIAVGASITVNRNITGSTSGSLVSSGIIGNGLVINATSRAGGNDLGSLFTGRWNDTGSLNNSNQIVFAVGSGTGPGNRRTSLYVTSGSVVTVSGSLDVKGTSNYTGSINVNGDTIMSSSTNFPLYVSGTISTNRLQFRDNPFNTSPSSNLGAIRMDGTNQTFYSTNYDLAQITTESMVYQTVVTGSNLVETGLRSNNNGSNYNLSLINQSGTGSVVTNANVIVTGSVRITSLMNLTPLNPLPTGVLGDLAVSSSAELYFNNGSGWTLIS